MAVTSIASGTPSATRTLASRIGRHALIYSAGVGANLLLTLATVAAFTRYLRPSTFGRLALLSFLTDMLATLYDVGLLQGTMRAIFAPSGAHDDARAHRERAQVMTTAVMASLCIAIVGSVIIISLAGPLGRLIVPGGPSDLVSFSALTGAAAAMTRLVSNQLRYQRQPAKYNVVTLSRPVATLAVGIPLLTHSATLRSAVLASLAGTLLALLLSLIAMRRDIAPRGSLVALKRIWQQGRGWIPVSVSLWVVNGAGVVILAAFASTRTVGIYRAALRLGSISSYAIGIFFMAWGPLTRSALYQGVRQQVGVIRLNRVLVTVYACGAAIVIVVLAILQHELIAVAAPAYRSGAPLIPLLGLPFTLYGFFRVIYISSTDPRRVPRFRALCVLAAVVFVAIAVATASSIGTYSVILGGSCAFALSAVLMVALGPAGQRRLQLNGSVVLRTFAACGLCLGGARACAALSPHSRTWSDIGFVLLLPVALLAVRVVTWRHVRSAFALVGPRRGLAGVQLRQRLRELHHSDSERLRELLHQSEGAVSDGDASAWLVETLATLTGVSVGPVDRGLLARFLLSKASAPNRDPLANALIAQGADPQSLDTLDRAATYLRRLPRALWPAAEEPEEPPELPSSDVM